MENPRLQDLEFERLIQAAEAIEAAAAAYTGPGTPSLSQLGGHPVLHTPFVTMGSSISSSGRLSVPAPTRTET